MAVLDNILSNLEARRNAGENDFLELVHRVANDDEPALAEVENVLRAANKTPKDLQVSVAQLVRRRELAEQMAAAADSAAEQQAIESEKNRINRELEKAQAQAQFAMANIAAREAVLEGLRRAATSAKHELIETAPRKLHEQQAELSAKRDTLSRQRDELKAMAKRCSDNATLARERAAASKDNTVRASYERDADAAEKRAAELIDKMKPFDDELSFLEMDSREVSAMMLQP